MTEAQRIAAAYGNAPAIQGGSPTIQGGGAVLQGGSANIQPAGSPNPTPVVRTNPTQPASLKGTMTTPRAPQAPQAEPTPAPISSQPSGSGSYSSGQSMDPGGMAKYLETMQSKLKDNNALATMRALLVKGLYDTPLTQDELAKLPPNIAKGIQSGDKKDIELQIRLLNDQIKGRTNTLDQSVNFLTKAYTEDLDRLNKERQSAIDNVLNFAQVYGSQTATALRSLYGDEYVNRLKEMGVKIDEFTGIPTVSEIDKLTNGSGNTLGLSNQQIDNISPVANGFRNEAIVQNFNTIAEGYNFVKSLSSTTKNPTDDQALIYAFAKAMDPGSVVREGEYATVQKYAQSLAQSYGKSITQAISGTGFLSQTARESIKKTIESRYNVAKKNYDSVYSNYLKRISAAGGVDEETARQFLTDYAGGYDSSSGGSDDDPLGLFSSVGKTSASKPYLSTLGAITGANGSSLWKYGLDVDLKIGDPVLAPVSGKVIYAGKNGGFGNQIKIVDAGGNEIWLSHLKSGNVKVGQTVKAGQKIALGGNTGNTIAGKGGDGSHLDITMKNSKGQLLSAPQVQKYLSTKYV